MEKAAPAAPRKAPAKAKTPKGGTTAPSAPAKPATNRNWRTAAKTPEEVAQAIEADLAVKMANVQGARDRKKAAKVHKDAALTTSKAAKGTEKRGPSTASTPSNVKSKGKTGENAPADLTATIGARARERKIKPHVAIDEPMIQKILAEVSEGKSLYKVCRGDKMPDRVSVLTKFNSDPALRLRWEGAMEARAHKYAEETIEIADDGSNDTYVDADGMVKTDHDVIARSKLRVHARQWYAAKLSPKFKDKVDVNHGVQPDNPIASLLAQVAGTSLGIVPGNDE